MDTVNKIIILCEEPSSKMFPFDDCPPCLLPIGNVACIERLITAIRQYYSDEIIILSKASGQLKFLADSYNVQFIEKKENYVNQIYECSLECKAIAIFNAEYYHDEDSIKKMIIHLGERRNTILVSKFKEDSEFIDLYGIKEIDDSVIEIIAKPRSHYVNAIYKGVCVIDSSIIKALQYASKGFNNINCGQMPDDKYHLLNSVQNYIEKQGQITTQYTEKSSIELKFPWDIVEVNQKHTSTLFTICENVIGKGSSIDNSCLVQGNLVIGKNTIIKDNVIFEGNCIIGDNVIIEKGAIISKNTIIGSNSKLNHYCKIHENTVIGTNNKIGYCAEIAGITFDGVAAVHNCEVFGVIGSKVDIAAGVQMAILRFDDAQTVQYVDGKKYYSKYTNNIFIGNYTRTGVGNIFYPGVKVGSRCAIYPGAIVNKDISHNSLVKVKQEIELGSWGSNKYGW